MHPSVSPMALAATIVDVPTATIDDLFAEDALLSRRCREQKIEAVDSLEAKACRVSRPTSNETGIPRLARHHSHSTNSLAAGKCLSFNTPVASREATIKYS
jgi:hypothetical protein